MFYLDVLSVQLLTQKEVWLHFSGGTTIHLKFLRLIRLLTLYRRNVGVFSYKNTKISSSQQMPEEHDYFRHFI